VKGMLLTMGVPLWRNFRSAEDSAVVARLRAEGAVVLCKTNMPEFGLSYDTGNNLFGQTKNPYNAQRYTLASQCALWNSSCSVSCSVS
jgi:amidase